MNSVYKFAAVFVVAWALNQQAQAEDTAWREPGGRFSLSFQELGWTALPPERAAAAGDILIITRNDTLHDGRIRTCAVSQRPSHAFDGDQEAANVYLDRITAADVEQNLKQPVRNFTHSRVGNVSTFDYTVLLNGTQMHTRDFVLAGGGQMTLFDMTCGTPPPTTDDEAQSISAVLNSLTILSVARTPATTSTPADWVLRSPSPGAAPCRAVKLGGTVDTQLLRNRDGHLVLIAGHGDWEHSGGQVQASLSIDGAPPVSVTGMPIGPVFMVLMADEQLAQLRNAHSVQWHLPWGEFTADVSGLGSAFDAIGICPG